MAVTHFFKYFIIVSLIVAPLLYPIESFAITYAPGQTLDPACLPTDSTCIVINPSATNVAAFFQATSTTATSTFAGGASSTNVTVSNTLIIGTLTGILKAVAGVVQTALVNLASDVTGILAVANGGTGWANLAATNILEQAHLLGRAKCQHRRRPS
jgi:hypothetical protein